MDGNGLIKKNVSFKLLERNGLVVAFLPNNSTIIMATIVCTTFQKISQFDRSVDTL